MNKIRKIKAHGKGCRIMIGDKEIQAGDGEWSFDGYSEMTWRQWVLFKVKRILGIKLNPRLYTD